MALDGKIAIVTGGAQGIGYAIAKRLLQDNVRVAIADVDERKGQAAEKDLATLGDVRFIVYIDGRGGLINPTLSEYVIAREVYVTDESKLKNFGVGNHGIELGGVNFEGPFEKSHALFIDKTWTYGVREPFPKEKVVA